MLTAKIDDGDTGRQSPQNQRHRQKKWKEIAPYALISLVSFLVGAAILMLLIWNVDLLIRYGLIGKLYYIVLLPLGLSAAAFLFGVLESFATYSGKQFGGKLVLGGPIVAAVLVVLGGYLLNPIDQDFPLTVYIHGEAGQNQIVLRNKGKVFLDLGPKRESSAIGENGQAYFPSIPGNYRGKEIIVGIESDEFELPSGDKKYRLDGNNLYVQVRKKAGQISGFVQNRHNEPIKGAHVTVAELSCQTDDMGRFSIRIPGDQMQKKLLLRAAAPGYALWEDYAYPGSNDLTVVLRRK